MAKFFQSIGNLAREIAGDLAASPRTRAAWPAVKKDLHEFYTGFKSDMFAFRATTLTPVTAPAVEKLDGLLAQEGSAAKVEQMLEVRDAVRSTLGKTYDKQEKKGFITLGLTVLAMIGAGLVFGAGALLTALFVGGAAVGKFMVNRDAAGTDSYAVSTKVNAEVMKIAANDASQVFAAPRVQQILAQGALKKAFNVGRWATPDESYAALAKRTAKPAAASTPTA
jgi:hypothetical protein